MNPNRAPDQATGLAGYLASLRSFSRNARLFLVYALFSNLGTGVWNVMFNLYLLRLGYGTTFIGLFWLVDMVFHGMFAFPAGLIGDKIGRRKTFILATILNIVARGALLFTQDPSGIIVLAAVAGMGEGFHAVAGAPFMMENSEPRERPHLFSLYWSFWNFSMFVGSLAGGFLPLLFANVLAVDKLDPGAARWALVASLPLTFIALVPLAVIREKPVALVESFKDLFTLRNIVSYNVIAKLFLCSLFIGTAFGLTVRFFNIFFNQAHGASDDQVGVILAIASLAATVSILASPLMTRKWGKVRGTVFSLAGSIPLLFFMAEVPGLGLAATFLVLRGAVYSLSQPLREQLSMEFIVAKERATTAGLVHMAFDLGGAAGAGLGGALIVGGEFLGAFGAAAAIFAVPAALYYVFFLKLEQRQQAVPAPLTTRPG